MAVDHVPVPRVGVCVAQWGLMASLMVSGSTKIMADSGESRQKAKSAVVTVSQEVRYLVYLPEDYSNPKKKPWPLLLFLHGAGERGDDLERVKIHGPPKLIEQGKAFPFIVVSPQCPRGQRWDASVLAGLLEKVQKEYAVDPKRIYVTGLSMGGFGTFALASLIPDKIAAIAPVCGGGERFWAPKLARVPVWAFHGAKDRVVPADRSRQMVEAIRKAGGEAKLTIYPDAGHDSWTATYDTPELYTWLLKHRRP